MKKYLGEVHISLRNGVKDNQGMAVTKALENIGFPNVSDVRMGKRIMVEFAAESKEQADTQIKDMCEKLLANTVIEQYEITISVVDNEE